MGQGLATPTFSHLPSFINKPLTVENPQRQEWRELKKIQLDFRRFFRK
jgi:hypothetical protein